MRHLTYIIEKKKIKTQNEPEKFYIYFVYCNITCRGI